MIPILWFALLQPAHWAPVRGLRCGSGPALIIETQTLPGIGRQRELVLWMCGAEKHEDEFDPEAYTCPDQSTGHFYRGRARVSLVDLQTGKPVNTVPILPSETNKRTFDLPYKIASYFYYVDGPRNQYGEGTPRILRLKDYNGDGEALEFALFNALNCTIVETALFGYSKSRDRVIQYPVHLVQRDGKNVTERNSPWLNRVFLQQPVRPGFWKWEYQSQDGGVTHYEVSYNPAKERFEGEIVIGTPRGRPAR